MRFLIALFTAFLFCLFVPVVALAQDVVDPTVPIDLGMIFGSAAALAAFAVTAVQFIRAHLWKTLDGLAVVAVTWVLCVLLSILGYYLGATSFTAVGQAIGFGVSAGILAVGGVNLAAKLTAGKQLPTQTK